MDMNNNDLDVMIGGAGEDRYGKNAKGEKRKDLKKLGRADRADCFR